MVPNKACPVVFRDGSLSEILVFRHPLAGIQLVKGTIEPGERPAAAALRELREESGITDAHVEVDLGLWDAGYLNHIWSFHLCATPQELPESWVHWTEDDGGHNFEFFWHPLAHAGHRDWHPLFRRALAVIVERTNRAVGRFQ